MLCLLVPYYLNTLSECIFKILERLVYLVLWFQHELDKCLEYVDALHLILHVST